MPFVKLIWEIPDRVVRLAGPIITSDNCQKMLGTRGGWFIHLAVDRQEGVFVADKR
jgi:hypothetical protein